MAASFVRPCTSMSDSPTSKISKFGGAGSKRDEIVVELGKSTPREAASHAHRSRVSTLQDSDEEPKSKLQPLKGDVSDRFPNLQMIDFSLLVRILETNVLLISALVLMTLAPSLSHLMHLPMLKYLKVFVGSVEQFSEALFCDYLLDPFSCHPKYWYSGLLLFLYGGHVLGAAMAALYLRRHFGAVSYRVTLHRIQAVANLELLSFLAIILTPSVALLIPVCAELFLNPIIDNWSRPFCLVYLPLLATTTYYSSWALFLYQNVCADLI